MPEWIVKLARRILALEEGCWQILLIYQGGVRRWTVTRLGKVEES